MKAEDVYEKVTQRVIKQLRTADPRDWRAPWHGALGLPRNAQTGVAYRGGNVLALWLAELDHDYPTSLWGTYRQWRTLLGYAEDDKTPVIRKGERNTGLVKWVMPDERKAKPGEEDKRRRAFPYGFAVFNLAQLVTPPPGFGVEEMNDDALAGDELVTADAYFKAVGARMGRGNPAYHPKRDTITMPPRKAFPDPARYFSVLAHEHVHWTGAPSRLDRVQVTDHTTPEYAFEELVAELGAAFLDASLGLADEPREDHAQYVASWITLLANDNKALYRAASLAQRAVGFLDERVTANEEVA